MQETYMMLKPDAFINNNEDKILKMLEDNHLIIASKRKIKIDMEVMKLLLEHYQGVIDAMDKNFNFTGKLFNTFYYDAPHYIMPMKIQYEGEQDIITYTRNLVGKTNPGLAGEGTIRATFSHDNYDKANAENRLVNNVIHASDSLESAQRELNIWKMYL